MTDCLTGKKDQNGYSSTVMAPDSVCWRPKNVSMTEFYEGNMKKMNPVVEDTFFAGIHFPLNYDSWRKRVCSI